jgi:hypothetical protein
MGAEKQDLGENSNFRLRLGKRKKITMASALTYA